MLCTDVLENFLLNQKLINNSNETILYYKQRIGYFISFVGNIEVENLSISHYNSYVLYLQNKVTEKKQKLSSYTIKTSLNAVKIFINYCYKQGFNNCNFVINIKPYKVNKNTIVVLTPSEINLLLSSQNEYTCLGLRNLLIISLMLDAGLRVSEVINLDVGDINLELELIRVFGKGRKERLVPLTDTIRKYYEKYIFLTKLVNGALLIDFNTNLRITTSCIRDLMRVIKNKYGFKKLHPHYLRHTFATYYLLNGGDPVNLQLILGHETLYMTEHYLHISSEMTMSCNKKYSPLTNIKKPSH